MGNVRHVPGLPVGVHGFSTDKEGNLYTAEVRTGRVQKYAPRKAPTPILSWASRGLACGRSASGRCCLAQAEIAKEQRRNYALISEHRAQSTRP